MNVLVPHSGPQVLVLLQAHHYPMKHEHTVTLYQCRHIALFIATIFATTTKSSAYKWSSEHTLIGYHGIVT